MKYLVDWIRDDFRSNHNETFTDSFVVEMTEEQAKEVHDIVGNKYGQSLIVNPIEINTFEELLKELGVNVKKK